MNGLELLALQLGDFATAEVYCIEYFSGIERTKLLHQLFSYILKQPAEIRNVRTRTFLQKSMHYMDVNKVNMPCPLPETKLKHYFRR